MNQELSTIWKIPCIAAITDKKVSVFCVPGVLYPPLQSTVQIK